ncbi:fructosamine kinase family protein [Collinsella sp. An2]|uniref:fructosamine kinase family protein n=1 Tax=Collinsella sp. An2 TaxID=1965585 RepID=UPI000B365F8B|nr:fructosamine kinase family protein [Collinsella sp. An2]OUP11148.1 hypothetical protein B5F33_01915 [Collinsella sp. An2]
MPSFSPTTVTKTASGATDELLCEAAGLRWLAEAEPAGGIRVARVREASRTRLVEERIVTGSPTQAAARRIGEALARTHAAGGDWFGCPPPECPAATGIGRAGTPYVPREQATTSWGAFFAEHRIMYYVRLLRDDGSFGRREVELFEQVARRVARGDFDVPQPQLVEEAGVACARLHGDLWAGNVLYLADVSSPTGGALIDPMAYGGHAETDLAMLQLFGYPYLEDVLAGYDAASPLADGWRERVGLHQLAPLLLHCVLFGGGYLGEAIAVARQYR